MHCHVSLEKCQCNQFGLLDAGRRTNLTMASGKRQAVTCDLCRLRCLCWNIKSLSRSDCLQFSLTPRRQANQLNSGKSPRQSCCMLYVVKPLVRKPWLSFLANKTKNCHVSAKWLHQRSLPTVMCQMLHQISQATITLLCWQVATLLEACGHKIIRLKIEILFKLQRSLFLGHVGSINGWNVQKWHRT